MLRNGRILVYAGGNTDFARSLCSRYEAPYIYRPSGDEGGMMVVIGNAGRDSCGELHNGEVLVFEGDKGRVDWAYSESESAGSSVAVVESGAVSGVQLIQRNGELECTLFSEWSGSFPMYYVQIQHSLLISNCLSELQSIVRRDADIAGVVQYLSEGFFVSDRTCLEGVTRLSAGQRLTIRLPSEVEKLVESSQLWAGYVHAEGEGTVSLVEHGRRLLQSAITRSTINTGKMALMMSGGWDSRTLLGFLMAGNQHSQDLLCYFHGDVGSREAELVRSLCHVAGSNVILRPILAESFSLEWLEKRFQLTGNVVFPHWHAAGEALADAGAGLAVSGVYGEVLGGHYGRSILYEGLGKAFTVAQDLIGVPVGKSRTGSSVSGEKALGDRYFKIWPWAVHRDLGKVALEQTENDLNRSIARLLGRDVPNDWRLVEAFVSEHRGGQFIAEQVRSCRPDVDIALPLADVDLLGFATSLDATRKVHNRFNKELLKNVAPRLLNYPMAATLVQARRPIIVQETSRAVRRLQEKLIDTMRGINPRIERKRHGWANFEAVRESRALEAIADCLDSSLWNKAEIVKQCKRYTHDQHGHSQPLMDQMMKILSIDWTIKGRPS